MKSVELLPIRKLFQIVQWTIHDFWNISSGCPRFFVSRCEKPKFIELVQQPYNEPLLILRTLKSWQVKITITVGFSWKRGTQWVQDGNAGKKSIQNVYRETELNTCTRKRSHIVFLYTYIQDFFWGVIHNFEAAGWNAPSAVVSSHYSNRFTQSKKSCCYMLQLSGQLTVLEK